MLAFPQCPLSSGEEACTACTVRRREEGGREGGVVKATRALEAAASEGESAQVPLAVFSQGEKEGRGRQWCGRRGAPRSGFLAVTSGTPSRSRKWESAAAGT